MATNCSSNISTADSVKILQGQRVGSQNAFSTCNSRRLYSILFSITNICNNPNTVTFTFSVNIS